LSAVISRIATVLIIGFWATMTCLLVRMEVNPEESRFLQVPVSLVMKMMFLHGLDSELSIYNNGDRVGSLSLRPKTQPNQARTLSFDGSLWLKLPGLERQRFHSEGVLQMDHSFGVHETSFKFSMPSPPLAMEMKVNDAKVLHYKVQQGKEITDQRSISLDGDSANELLSALNIDPSALNQFQPGTNPPTVSARQSQIRVRGESVETYELVVKEADLEVANIFLSQLGQILLAKTAFGYTLRAVDIDP